MVNGNIIGNTVYPMRNFPFCINNYNLFTINNRKAVKVHMIFVAPCIKYIDARCTKQSTIQERFYVCTWGNMESIKSSESAINSNLFIVLLP